MISVDVDFDDASLRKILDGLSSRDRRAVLRRAISHEGRKFRTSEKRELAEITGLTKGRVAKALTAKTNSTALEFVLTARDSYTTMKEFKPTQTAAGVMASPWGKRQLFKSAFKVDRFGDVFVREGPKRGPIQLIFGPAIPVEMVRESNKTDDILFRFRDSVADRVLHEISFMIGS